MQRNRFSPLNLSVPEAGKRLLPLPIAAWHATVGVQALDGIGKGDRVLVHGLTALGNVTNTAARLTSIARGGEIIVDTETLRGRRRAVSGGRTAGARA